MTTDTARFTIGSETSCGDGPCGPLSRVVVDPVARTLTHLVVGPAPDADAGRLVPVDLVESVGAAGEITLRCTRAQFDALEAAEETRFLPGAAGTWGYSQDHMLSWPYYGLGLGGAMLGGDGGMGGRSVALADAGSEVTRERVPVGEVQVRRGEHVHAVDGDIGRVQGLVIDPVDHRVTHVLLDEGHLWGRTRVAIPIRWVTGIDDGVRLELSKDEVRDLPQIDLAHED